MKSQKINIKDLKVIHDNVCDSWKKRIMELVLWNDKSSIEVSEDLIQEGYNAADDDQKKLIRKYFDIKVPEDLFNKIKTYSDVCKELGEKEKTSSYDKIKQIQRLFNGDWKADWLNPNQYKYYPYFERASGGWRFSDSLYLYGSSDAEVAYYKDEKTASFVGKTLLNIYIDFIENN